MWKARDLSEQLSLAATLDDARNILKNNGTNGKELTLLDGGVILGDVSGVKDIQHYDKDEKRIGVYKPLYDTIGVSGLGKTKAEFEQFVGSLTLPNKIERASPTSAIKGQKSAVYNMPDVKGRMIQVDFDGVLPADVKANGVKVMKITFTGERL